MSIYAVAPRPAAANREMLDRAAPPVNLRRTNVNTVSELQADSGPGGASLREVLLVTLHAHVVDALSGLQDAIRVLGLGRPNRLDAAVYQQG